MRISYKACRVCDKSSNVKIKDSKYTVTKIKNEGFLW